MLSLVPYHRKRQDPTFRADPVSSSNAQSLTLTHTNKTMITVLFEDCNDFSQNFYNQVIDDLPFNMVECTCGKKGCLIRHGHYCRSVKLASDLLLLNVQRVRCKACGTSHALLPSLLVPYSQITLEDLQAILLCVEGGDSPVPVMERNNLIDENNVKYIIRQFRKHWKERIRSLGLSLIDCLAIRCILAYSRQFMQIHRTRNKLFSCTNTA